MAIAPRFRRVAALQREFVDREPLLAAFEEEIERLRVGADSPAPGILNVTGVGGIGKSRLLRELRVRAPKGWRTATLDLQVPTMRQQEDALAVLRAEFGSQGVRLDRFDIAYAVLWQRIHPHLRIRPSTFTRWPTNPMRKTPPEPPGSLSSLPRLRLNGAVTWRPIWRTSG
jgi:hypothetical protein